MDKTHMKDCAYDLTRIEVINALSEAIPGQTNKTSRWEPQSMKHAFTFKTTPEITKEW